MNRLPLLLFFIGIFAYVVWWYRRSTQLLHEWAESNGYTNLQASRAMLFNGPFGWTTSRGQQVFKVQVYDPAIHRTRAGWVRCGSFWSGMASDQVDVRWDDDADARSGWKH